MWKGYFACSKQQLLLRGTVSYAAVHLLLCSCSPGSACCKVHIQHYYTIDQGLVVPQRSR